MTRAGDRARLAALRGGLRQRMQASPLMDSQQFAADVEAAFRGMWKTWCDSMTPITIEQAIEIALAHHRAGRLAEAETLYRQVLSLVPGHAEVLHLLGVLAGQTAPLRRRSR